MLHATQLFKHQIMSLSRSEEFFHYSMAQI